MSQLVISALDTGLLSRLGARAASHGRTEESEARQILAEAIGGSSSSSWTGVDAIRERLAASERVFGDSTTLLREDRER
jgi:plasmid stability protein